ncbi:MAG: hypothetical protein ABH864_02225 [archaeon]
MTEVATIEFLALIAGIAVILIAILAAIYVYLSIVTMALAKKTQTKRGWLAWIPFANFYLYSRMAGMHWWPIFLLVGLFIPYLEIPAIIAFAVFNFIWFWKIFEKVEKPGWWSLFPILLMPGWLLFLVLLGVAAWSGENTITQIKTPAQIIPLTQDRRPIPKKPIPKSSPRLDRVKKLKSSLK